VVGGAGDVQDRGRGGEYTVNVRREEGVEKEDGPPASPSLHKEAVLSDERKMTTDEARKLWPKKDMVKIQALSDILDTFSDMDDYEYILVLAKDVGEKEEAGGECTHRPHVSRYLVYQQGSMTELLMEELVMQYGMMKAAAKAEGYGGSGLCH
jgi:hypothetical protein